MVETAWDERYNYHRGRIGVIEMCVYWEDNAYHVQVEGAKGYIRNLKRAVKTVEEGKQIAIQMAIHLVADTLQKLEALESEDTQS